MKTNQLTVLIFVFLCIPWLCFSQVADDVTGIWLNYDKDAQIEIFKNGEKYYGKIIWLKNPVNPDGTPSCDIKNPDEKLRSRKKMGLQILNNFSFDAKDKEWEGGTIYDPKSGSTYKAYIWFEDGNLAQLMLRGYIGFSLIGKTSSWTREKAKRN